MNRHRAFTLIELLIVVAIIAILSGAVLSVTVGTVRADAEERIRATLREDAYALVRSLLRDLQLAAVVEGPEGDTTQTLSIAYSHIEEASRRVTWRRAGPRVERRVWLDDAATPTVTLITNNITEWQFERDGTLLRLEFELAVNRYTKDFVYRQSVALRPGGLVVAERREAQ